MEGSPESQVKVSVYNSAERSEAGLNIKTVPVEVNDDRSSESGGLSSAVEPANPNKSFIS